MNVLGFQIHIVFDREHFRGWFYLLIKTAFKSHIISVVSISIGCRKLSYFARELAWSFPYANVCYCLIKSTNKRLKPNCFWKCWRKLNGIEGKLWVNKDPSRWVNLDRTIYSCGVISAQLAIFYRKFENSRQFSQCFCVRIPEWDGVRQ